MIYKHRIILSIIIFFIATYVKAENGNETKHIETNKTIDLSQETLIPKEQFTEGGPVRTEIKHKNKIKPRKGADFNETTSDVPSTINKVNTEESIKVNQTSAEVVKETANPININSINTTSVNLTSIITPNVTSTNATASTSSTSTTSTTSTTTSTTSTTTSTTTTTTTTSTTTTTPKPTKPHITHSLDEELGNLKPNAKPNTANTNSNTEDKKDNYNNNEQQATYSESNNSEGPLNIAMKAQGHPDYIAPVVVTIFAVPLFVGLTVFMVRKLRDFWEKRHYRRMDFLIDGMYND